MERNELLHCAKMIENLNKTVEPESSLEIAQSAINKYALEMLQAEEQGLLVRLPVPIGSKVNFIDLHNGGEVYRQAYITGIGLSWTNQQDIGDYIPVSVIGKTVIPAT